MAKAAWCTVTPTSGKGSGTINISATAHTGRTARSTSVTVQNQSGTKPSKAITVNQAAKPEFVSFQAKTMPLPVAGGKAMVIGISNKAILQVDEDGGNWLDYAKIKINGIDQKVTGEGTFEIGNNLGTNEQYTFELSIDVPANPYASPVEFTYRITGEANGYLKVTQPAATSTLSTDKTSMDLITTGTGQNIAITSNDNWAVS